jgi:hypothetical protein
MMTFEEYQRYYSERLEEVRVRGGYKTPWFFPICNESGCICNDDQDADGKITDAEGRYEKTDRLHPGEPGYVLYVVGISAFPVRAAYLSEARNRRARIMEQSPG